MDPHANLISKALNCEDRFVRGDRTAMNQHAGGLVDHYDRFVAVYDFQHVAFWSRLTLSRVIEAVPSELLVKFVLEISSVPEEELIAIVSTCGSD